ncbi:hypothetical protein [Aquibacillus albus]|uniref:YtxH domain-containing protein n=1 Tax=Aquibacillus albus TaxID=1168171 RepID=A0ABS2N286_9BACI|nr:hypothetical protein [Aquibacillus albus]MBM7572239.1 hypothetical protein [Aquibacillus albus]
MKKRVLYSAIGVISAGTITLLLSVKGKREELLHKIDSFKEKVNKADSRLPIEEAGIPEKDSLENARMVAEGSQFGVRYYQREKNK